MRKSLYLHAHDNAWCSKICFCKPYPERHVGYSTWETPLECAASNSLNHGFHSTRFCTVKLSQTSNRSVSLYLCMSYSVTEPYIEKMSIHQCTTSNDSLSQRRTQLAACYVLWARYMLFHPRLMQAIVPSLSESVKYAGRKEIQTLSEEWCNDGISAGEELAVEQAGGVSVHL